jgi:hypothetical protein
MLSSEVLLTWRVSVLASPMASVSSELPAWWLEVQLGV